MPNNHGLFVALEGIDGAGKSTQSKLLIEALVSLGHDVIVTREPGGAPGAEEIRKLLVEGETDKWSPETEILLFTAARRDHLENTILPALKAGKIVVTDRFADSTRVYQGVVRSDLRETVDKLHEIMIGIEPDLSIIVDVDPAQALSRGLARNTAEERFEKFGVDFQIRLREGFRKLAQSQPERCKLVDGNRTADEISHDIIEIVKDALHERD